MLKVTWIEGGLLYKYDQAACLDIIDNFKFNGVMINPYGMINESLNLARLLYVTYPKSFLKIMVCGGGSNVDYDMIDAVKDLDYVIAIDDGTPAVEPHLQKIKDMKLDTLLVHGYDDYVRQLMKKKLIDYSMPMDYPYYPDRTGADFKAAIRDMRRWAETYDVSYIPALQVFGQAFQNWRFPTVAEIRDLIAKDVFGINSNGFLPFEPMCGVSRRGETFDGFLSHPEVFDIIRDPQPSTTKLYSYVLPSSILLLGSVTLLVGNSSKKLLEVKSNE